MNQAVKGLSPNRLARRLEKAVVKQKTNLALGKALEVGSAGFDTPSGYLPTTKRIQAQIQKGYDFALCRGAIVNRAVRRTSLATIHLWIMPLQSMAEPACG